MGSPWGPHFLNPALILCIQPMLSRKQVFFSGNTKHPSCQTHLHKPHITLLARFQQNTTEKSQYQSQRSSRWVTILKQYKWSRGHLIGQLIQYYHRVKWLFGKEMDCMWADEELSTWSNLITKQIIISMYHYDHMNGMPWIPWRSSWYGGILLQN